MRNLSWKCISKYGDKIYFWKNSEACVHITDGINVVWEYDKKNVTGCTCNGDKLWLSVMNSNKIICVDSQKNEIYIPILAYDTVRILNMVTGQEDIMVIEGMCGNKKELFLYNGINGEQLCKFPIYEKYIDFTIEINGKGFLLCETSTAVPARYNDEIEDTKVLFFAELIWDNQNLHAKIEREISLYLDNNYDYPAKLFCGDNLRFPLFDQYLSCLPEQKSFSSTGKSVIYYSKDINGLIIGNPLGGRIHRIVFEAGELADCDYYYNEVSEELFVITQFNEIKRYELSCNSDEAIEKLNLVYDDAYNKKRNLNPKNGPVDMQFVNILYRAIDSCTFRPLVF